MWLYLIRHGETPWNAEGHLQGAADVPLNEKGILLAELTAKSLQHVPFDMVISSPLSRARTTADIILGTKDVPMILDTRIREIDWGEWDGLGALASNFEIPDQEFHKFYTDPFGFKGAPGGESIVQLCSRTKVFYEELTRHRPYAKKTILISTHGAAIRGILNNLYADPSDFWHGGVPANCAVNVVEVKDGVGKLIVEDQIFYDEKYREDYYHLIEATEA